MPTLDPYVRSKQAKKPKPQYARICPECGAHFVTVYSEKLCCHRRCTEAYWRKSRPRLISWQQVRREDGLDRPQVPHVCDTSRFGFCVPCRLQEIHAGRNHRVLLTDEATRTRTRESAQRKVAAALTPAQAGD